MTKSSKPKNKQTQTSVHVNGNVSGTNVVFGDGNTINVQEVLKTTYGLFTIPQPVTDFTGREEEL